MGGLTTALSLARAGFTDIHVYEYAPDLGFVGAGIQLAPNMARILDRLGVWTPIAAEATTLASTSIRQGDSDKELANVDLKYVGETYGYPHMVGHRSNLAGSIYEGCLREKGVKFHFSTKVSDVQGFSADSKPTFLATPKFVSTSDATNGDLLTDMSTAEPQRVGADVILAADGVKSPTRTALLSHLNATAEVEDSGQAAYRIMLSREQMSTDPELAALLDTERATRWIGERRHIIAYPVSNKSIYNISTAQPDTNFAAAPSATYTTRGSKSAMLEVYRDFCPLVQRMLNLVDGDEVCEWKLRVHSPLPSWVAGRVALLGDACHPTLPHLAQGAAQAIEDAAVLGVVLAKMPDAGGQSVEAALKVYERIRKERAETLVALAASSGRAMHLGEGKAKEERDREFEKFRSGGGKGSVPDKWADADVQKMIYGHDCTKVAEEQFDELFGKVS
jgi:salicylate hydroxylase